MSDVSRPSTIVPASTPSVARPAALPTQTTRDRVVELLTQHYANDRIALDEFERRTTAVFAARSTDELQALVADLADPVLPAVAPEHGRISAIVSSNEQRSAMVVPRYLEIVAVMGSVNVDLRDSAFAEGVTVIDVDCIFGSVELTLPTEVRVEAAGRTIFGSFTSDASPTPGAAPAARVVRISGRAIFGSVEAMIAAPRLPASIAAPALAPR